MRSPPYRVFVLVVLIVLAGCTAGVSPTESTTSPAGGQSLEQGVTVTVVRVTDGDTMDVQFSDGREETIRLLGVDTPEVRAENQPHEWEGIPETEAGHDIEEGLYRRILLQGRRIHSTSAFTLLFGVLLVL